jgi:hypothetical protein
LRVDLEWLQVGVLLQHFFWITESHMIAGICVAGIVTSHKSDAGV